MTIDFGIDLGTTNSLIARYREGKVEVFRNPAGWRNTLPSVVAFRKERVLVGDKAKEFVEKDPANVFGFFKRKMGTPETYRPTHLPDPVSPVDLSAIVLKELKTFLVDGEAPESVVVTIPASFDTIQSNATKKAGYAAGFREVVLLQEPIAASLAYANEDEGDLSGAWIVYDLGGGTFDAALVRLQDGEMRVLDHEGDNYLGGYDFDNLIIDKLVAPRLQEMGRFEDISASLRDSGGRLNRLYYHLLFKAEEAKIMLSTHDTAEFEIEIEDDDGKEIEAYLTISRRDFEELIRPKIDSTLHMLHSLIEKNNLSPRDLSQVVLVGGSTYIPFVREQISRSLGLPVNFNVDPTTAVVVGAAYYAGTKSRSIDAPSGVPPAEGAGGIEVKTAYQKTSNQASEYFTAEITGFENGQQFRLTRADGGYDSGFKPVESRISEMLPLINDAFNIFHLRFFSPLGDMVPAAVDPIGIMHGRFSLHGQPLPNDICIEVDDVDNNTTRLEPIFEKNAILPLKKTLFRTVSRTIEKGSSDQLLINVLEGSRDANPKSCVPLGIISITGREIPMSLVKGSDVEITLEISESRDLKVNVWVAMTSQEIENVFNPSERYVNTAKLRAEVMSLLAEVQKELKRLEASEQYDVAARVNRIRLDLNELSGMLNDLREEDAGDLKYQMEERKRRLAQSLDLMTRQRKKEMVLEDYFQSKRNCEYFVNKSGQSRHRERYDRIIADEREYLASEDAGSLRLRKQELESLAWEIEREDPEYLSFLFHWYASHPDENYKDPKKAAGLKSQGYTALEKGRFTEVLTVIYGLYALLPDRVQADAPASFTGLG